MVKHLIFGLIGIFAALTGPVRAASDGVTHFTLENGMEFVLVEDHRAPVVTHMLWYRVGSADEQPGQSGVAHFLEHLLFKGTDKLAPGEFSEIIAANGGTDNAFTFYDYTGYFQRVAADRLPLVFELEADRMRNLVLTDEEVLPERDVVLEERNSRVENSPDALFGEQGRASFFRNHPYGQPVIGWKHEIEALTTENALDFYELYYAPNNAISVVVGDITPDELRKLAETYFAPLEPSDHLPERIRPKEPPQLAPLRIVFSDERVRQPYLVRRYKAPNRQSGDQRQAAALTILAELLGGSGLTSVMGREMQLNEKVAIATSAGYDGDMLDPRDFALFAVPADGVSLEDLEASLDQVIARFLETGVDEAHLERIRTQIRATEVYGRDSGYLQARRYGEALSIGLTVEDVEAWPDVLQSITTDEIMDAARIVFDPKQSFTGWVLRESKEESGQ